MSKSVFTDPAPGEKLLRRHVIDVDRELETVKQWYELAQSGDTDSIRMVNASLLNLEKLANKLRTAEVPEALEDRANKAIQKADEALATFAPTDLPKSPDNAPSDDNQPLVGEEYLRETAPSVDLSTRSRSLASTRSVSSKHRDAAMADQNARKEHLKNTQRLEAKKDAIAIAIKQRDLEKETLESEKREQERQLQAIQLEIDAANELEQARLADEAESLSDASSSHGRSDRVESWVESVSNHSASAPVVTSGQGRSPTASQPRVSAPWQAPTTTSAPTCVSSSLAASATPFQPTTPYASTPVSHLSFSSVQTVSSTVCASAPAAAPAVVQSTPTMVYANPSCLWPPSYTAPTSQATQPPGMATVFGSAAQAVPQIQPGPRPQLPPNAVVPYCPPAYPNPVGPSYPPVFPSPVVHTVSTPPSGVVGGDVMTSLLSVNLKAHAHNLMVQNRPPKDKRFNGTSGADFETFWNLFQSVTCLDGITDQMRLFELRHWLVGPAAEILTQHENEPDFAEALRKVKTQLDEEFGRKSTTASSMLENLLSGSKLKVTDTSAIQEFILKLEGVHKRAIETNREPTFSTVETYGKILCRKLPFFLHKWAPIARDHEAKQKRLVREHGGVPVEVPFSIFVDYLRRSNEINMSRAQLRKQDATTTSSSDRGGSGEKSGKKYSVAATEARGATSSKANSAGKAAESTPADVAVTMTSRPKRKTVNPAAKQNKGKATESKAPAGAPPKAPVPQAALDPKPGEKPQRPECKACGKGKHDLDYCREFRQKTYEEKRTYVLSNGHCFNCTAKGHLASDCPEANKCTKCKGRHNTVLHEDRERPAVSNEQ